jgi:CHASE3 domain sensor protein
MKRSSKTIVTFGAASLVCFVAIVIILWQVL